MHKFIAVFVFTIMSSSAFAAKSSQVGLGMALDYGFGITAQFNGDINATIGNDGLGLDYLFLQKNLDSKYPINWYLAGGVGVDHIFDGNKNSSIKGRAVAGLDFDFASNFDVYLAAGPALKVYTDSDNDDLAKFELDALLGVRYFF